MPRIELTRYKNRIKWLYKDHFELLLLITLSSILYTGYYFIDSEIYISTIVAIILILIATLYYYTYFTKYQLLTDTFSEYNQYYYDIYAEWGVVVFNVFFLFVFAYIGFVLSTLFPSLGFGRIEYNELLLFLIQSVIDSMTLGFLETYSLALSSIKMEGIFAKTYVYMTKLAIDLAFIGSANAVIKESIQIKREIKNTFDSKKINKEFFSSLTPTKIKAIMKYYSKGGDDIVQYETELVLMLEKSNSQDVKNLILQIFQSTQNKKTFIACINYFAINKDFRFQRVCKKIKTPLMKQLLLEKGINPITGQRKST
jgi:hypothetical protein